MLRKVVKQVQGYRTQDGAGVSLVRVLGNQTVDLYDPFLMLDAFDSTNNPSDRENYEYKDFNEVYFGDASNCTYTFN